MTVLITYDVNVTSPGGQKRLRSVAKLCESRGQRVQNSVFECTLTPAQYRQLQDDLAKTIDDKKDSLRFYHLGNNYKDKVEHMGVVNGFAPDDVLIL